MNTLRASLYAVKSFHLQQRKTSRELKRVSELPPTSDSTFYIFHPTTLFLWSWGGGGWGVGGESERG